MLVSWAPASAYQPEGSHHDNAQQNRAAILQEHLHNAREHLSRRDEQRSARSQQSSSGIGGSVVFWLVVVADIVIAAMVLRLYLRKKSSRQ